PSVRAIVPSESDRWPIVVPLPKPPHSPETPWPPHPKSPPRECGVHHWPAPVTAAVPLALPIPNPRDPFLIRRVLPVWLGNNQHAHRSMRLCVQHFHPRCRIPGVPRPIEDRSWIGLLWLVIENQHDLPVRIDALIIVVVQFRRGDAVSGKNYVCAYIHVRAVRSEYVRILPLLLAARSPQANKALRPVPPILDQIHRLQKTAFRARRQSSFGKLRSNPLDRYVVAGL